MINKVSETVPEDKIAAAIGKISLRPNIDKSIDGKLHAAVKTAYESKKLSKAALYELKNVTLKRQAEILKELKQIKTFNLDMIKAKILQTPETEMIVQEKRNLLTKNNENRVMIKKLREITDQIALLECQYNTFASDVIKMLIYIRGFLENEEVQKYVEKKYPDMLKKFRETMERE